MKDKKGTFHLKYGGDTAYLYRDCGGGNPDPATSTPAPHLTAAKICRVCSAAASSRTKSDMLKERIQSSPNMHFHDTLTSQESDWWACRYEKTGVSRSIQH